MINESGDALQERAQELKELRARMVAGAKLRHQDVDTAQGNGRPDNPGSQGNGPGDFGGPPGAQVGGAGGYAHQDGSVPDAIESATDLGRIGPGQIVRSFTPGCDDGDATVPCAGASTSN